MTEMVECPGCRNTFIVPPGRCPDCGTTVETDEPAGGLDDVVVQYRLNHLASASGIAMAGFVTGAATWLLGRPGFGALLFLVSLLAAGVVLSRE